MKLVCFEVKIMDTLAFSDIAAILERERNEKEKIRKELEDLKIIFSEIEATNNHLIAATWRERDMKKKLAEINEELNKTKEVVENQKKRIEESINYSRKIQSAINPAESDIHAVFPKSFILYHPKDIISGDFPWIYKSENYYYAACVDCTGHGVPGAMMSMIGNLLLNDIINNGEELLPSEILLKLHHAVVGTLKQDLPGSNSNDGMDLGLCRINIKEKTIDFSGAHRPLFFLREGILTSFGGDKFPVGGIQYKGKNKYTDHCVEFAEGDRIFLFTDGFPDQIGGEHKRKLMTNGFSNLLVANASVPMTEVKNNLLQVYNDWKGNLKQIDDVLVIGIEF